MPRLLTLLAAAAVLGLLPVSAEAVAVKKKRCTGGTQVVRIGGRVRCVKVAKVRLPSKPAQRSALAVQRMIRAALISDARLPASELTPEVRQLLALPAIAKAAAELEALARSQATGASAGRRMRSTLKTLTGPTFSGSRGSATLNGTSSASISDTGQVAIDLALRLAQGGASTEIQVGVEMGQEQSLLRLCPDEAGRVVIERTTGGSLTTLVRKGGNVESAETVRTRTTTRSVGQNGPDGMLDNVTTTSSTTTTVTRRGVEVAVTAVESVSGPAGEPGKVVGTPSASATVKIDNLPAAETRAVETSIATQAVADRTDARIEAQMSDVGRYQLTQASKNWEDLDYKGLDPCMKVTWTPGSDGVLKRGQSRTVKGQIVATNGGKPLAATWKITAVDAGKFTGGGPAGPGGQTFGATGGKREATRTVAARLVITSRVGRMLGYWSATDQSSYTFTIDAKNTGEFATHSATGDVRETATLSPVQGAKPSKWTSPPVTITWRNSTATSKVAECTYNSPQPRGTMTVTAEQAGENQLKISMDFSADTGVLWTVLCPTDSGELFPVPGQPGVSAVSIAPLTFTLPLTGGTQPIAGDVLLGSEGFRSSGSVTVTPVGA